MDELEKLLENAGYTRGDINDEYQEHWSEMLNDFSDNFTFKFNEDESIEVYSLMGTLVGAFGSFDEMITTGLGN